MKKKYFIEFAILMTTRQARGQKNAIWESRRMYLTDFLKGQFFNFRHTYATFISMLCWSKIFSIYFEISRI